MIQTMGELDEYEEQNIAEGLIWLEDSTDDFMDYMFWISLHKKLFNNVWNWAGKIRKHELQNLDFLEPYNIRPALMELSKDGKVWFKDNSFPEKEIVARIHERLLTIHPFPNGNGRWARIITEHICAKKNIITPSWNLKMKDQPEQRRRDYISAVVEARKSKDFIQLIEVMFN